MLNVSTHNTSPPTWRRGSDTAGSGAGSRGHSTQGRRSNEIAGITEEDEEEALREEDEDIEEVDEFSPVLKEEGEFVEVLEEEEEEEQVGEREGKPPATPPKDRVVGKT